MAKSLTDSIVDQYKNAAQTLRAGIETKSAQAQAPAPSRVDGVAPPKDLIPLFEQASSEFGVPVDVLAALAQQESSYNRTAVGPATKYGHAKGMFQYIDQTAKAMGINPLDTKQSLQAAAKQLKERLDKGYSIEEAIAAHHGGDDRAQWGPKTKQYVKDVMGKAGKIGESWGGGEQPQGQPDLKDLQAQADAEEPGRYKIITPEEAERWNRRSDLLNNGVTLQDGLEGLKQRAPSPLSVENQQAVNAQTAPSPYSPENQHRVNAGLSPKDTREYQSFTEATGASLANVPERFNQSIAGLIQMAGEDLGQDRERYIADRARQLGMTPGDMKLLAWAGNEKLIDPKMAGPDALKFVKENIAKTLSPQQMQQLSASGIINPDEITAFAKDWRAEEQKSMEEVRAEPESAAFYGSAAIGSLAEMGPMIAAAATTRNPRIAMSIMSGQVGGQSYAEGREKGLSADEAQAYALLTTAAEVAPEALVVGQLLKPGAGILKKALEGSVLEGAQEAVTGALQAGVDKGFISPDMTFNEALIRIRDGAIIGALSGGAMGGTFGAVDKMTQRKQEAGAVQPQAPAAEAPADQNPLAGMDTSDNSLIQPAPQAQAQPEPQKPTGPLGRAAAKVAQSEGAERVTVQTPAGPVTGTAESYQQGNNGSWDLRMLGDDGQFYQFSNKDGVTVTTEDQVDPSQIHPESQADTRAQIEAILDPTSGKDTALITQNSAPAEIPEGLAVIETNQGTVVTSNPEKAAAVESTGGQLSTDQVGALLDYTTPKAETDGTVVQAKDAAGNVVHEEATNQQNIEQAATIAQEKAPEGGSVQVTDAQAALQERAAKVDYENMSEAMLRGKLRFIAEKIKEGGDVAALKAQRKAIESAINAKQAPAEPVATEAVAPEAAAAPMQAVKEEAPKKPPYASKEELDHLFGVDKKRAAALERIDAGKAWFGDQTKAKDFITKNGLKDTHEVVANGKRFDIKAKEQAAAPVKQAKPVEVGQKVVLGKGRSAGIVVAVEGDTAKIDFGNRTEKMTLQTIERRMEAAVEASALAPQSESQAIQDFFDGKRDDVPTTEEVNAELAAKPIKAKKISEGVTAIVIDPSAGSKPTPAAAWVSSSSDERKATLSAAGYTDGDQARAYAGSEWADLPSTVREKIEGKKSDTLKDGSRAIGRRKDGKMIYEDKNGVRYYADGGVRIQETVSMRPTRQGMVVERQALKPEFMTAEELAAEQKPGAEQGATKPAATGAETVNQTISAEIEKQKRRVARYKNEIAKAETMDEKRALLTKQQAAETRLTKMRSNVFQAEDLAAEAIKIGSNSAWTSAGFDLLFADATDAINSAIISSPAVPEAATKPAGYGASNKLVTADRAAEVRAKLKAKLNGSQLNSGFDPEILALGAELAAFHIEAGARKFADFAQAMAQDLDMPLSKVRPYLRGWFNGARDMIEDAGLSIEGMDGPDEVRAALAKLDAEVAEQPQEQSNDTQATKADADADAGDSEPFQLQANEPSGDAGAVRGKSDGAVRAERGSRKAVGTERAGGQQEPKQSGGAEQSVRADRGNSAEPSSGNDLRNYRIQPGELKRTGSWKATAEQNVRVVELVKQITAENRQATPEEKMLLTKFTGWGASEIANGIFPNQYGQFKLEWRELGERLKAAMTAEEYAQAKRTTQYAHYTSEPIIRSVHAAMERLGFNGGQVLEPGMGVGLFNGMMPDAMAANSQYTGIEYDSITGNIAKLLYPESNMIVGDYTATKLPRDFFDAAIGNPPFGNIKISNDPEYKRQGFLLHDYFFAKTIDRVKPGGLLVFVTSKGTMDKNSDRARKYLSERADLLGAIRLPQTAFKDNAGTEVVTDVIFLRKRMPGQEAAGEAWNGLAEVSTAQGPAMVNEYFAAHPEMVLGKHAKTGSMYRADEYTVEPIEGDITELFAKAVENLPENVYRTERGSTAERAAVQRRDYDPKVKKEGGIYVADDGMLMQVESGSGVQLKTRLGSAGKEIDLKPREIEWLKGYTVVRDALKQAQYDQLNDGAWEKSLKALNKAYADFTKQHGEILANTVTERENEDGTATVTRRFKNEALIRLDAEGALAYALESITDDGVISRGPVLEGRTLNKPTTPTITSSQDAMFVSLNDIGRFDLAEIARLAGKSQQEVIADLGEEIYQDPSAGWTTKDDYLSGNVVRKLKEAQAAARIDKVYDRNVESLKNVQPRALAPQDITVQLGSAWIPPSDVENFAAEVMGDKLRVNYSPVTGQWNVDGVSSRVSEWGTGDKKATDILDAVLNNRQLKVTYKDAEGKYHTDIEGTEKVNDIAKKLRAEFRKWIWTDTARADRLAKYYNENYNNIAPRKFDGSHLTLPGVSSRFALHPHQKRAIWRTIQQGDTYYAHAVGAGKTFTMIASGMEERRLGLSKKPMYVVPNQMLEQFSNEFLELYPTAQIMVADETNFHTHNRRKFIAQAALNDPDAIVITHSAFGRIGMSDEYTQSFIEKQIDDWREAYEDTDKSDRITRKKIETTIERLEKRIQGMISDKKDQLLTFEQLGVDRLFIDEGHEFRKLDFATNRGSIKGIDSKGSQRAMDLFMKVQYLREKTPGRALVMASGTPVTNTMGELYTIQKFFQMEQLEEDGDSTFDAWATHYGEVVDGLEQNAAGGYETVSRFAKFANVPELMSRVRSFMDVLTSDQLGDLVVRPDVEGGGRKMIVTPTPDGYKEFQKDLENRIRAIKNRKGPPNPGDDIILNVIGDGRFSAIDMRFIDPTLPSDPNSKLNLMLDDVISAYKATANNEYSTGSKVDPIKGSSLIIFTDIGLGEQSAKNRGFDMKAWIEKRLIEGGVNQDHIAYMRDNKSHAKKGRLFEDMRQGKKRILIGGKDMETGVNVQKRLTNLFHLDAPWYPASIEQREGRIIRQGNQNKKVNINPYATKGSYDSTMWSMNARKQRFIEQAMKGDDSVRSMEDVSEASAFEMAAALASGDERYLKLAGLKGDVERLNRLYSAHIDDQRRLRSEKMAAESNIKYNKEKIDELNAALAKREAIKPGEFAGKVAGKTYDNREDFSNALFSDFKALAESYTAGEHKLGSIGGFPIVYTGVEMRGGSFGADVSIELPNDPEPLLAFPIDPAASIAGVATRAANQVNGLERDISKRKDFIANSESTLEKINRRLGAVFPEIAELTEKKDALSELESELEAESKAAEAEQAAEQQPKQSVTGKVINTFSSAEKLESFLRGGPLGDVIGQRIDSGAIVLHDNASTFPTAGKVSGVAGLTNVDGVIHLNASALKRRTALGVTLHEAFHAGAEQLIGGKAWNRLVTKLGALRRQAATGSDKLRSIHDAALNRVESADKIRPMDESLKNEEFGAYLIEEYENMPRAFKAWVDEFVGAIKAWVLKATGIQAGKVTPAQLRAIAVSALRSNVNGARDTEGYSRDKKTGSKAFQEWFGNSKVVDENGEPLVVYHGSPDLRFVREDGVFKTEKGRYGFGRDTGAHWFAASSQVAKSYADPKRAFDYQRAEEGVMSAYLKMENPLIVDGKGQKWRDAQKSGKTGDVIESARSAGHDGVIIRNVKDNYQTGVIRGEQATDTYVVWDSTQIKSATDNNGNYDKADPDIRHSVADKRNEIALKKVATESGRPAFRSDDGTLLYGTWKHSESKGDLDDRERLPYGHRAHVVDGNSVWNFKAFKDGQHVANLTLQLDPKGNIEALHNIKAANKGRGAGETIVSSILAAGRKPLRVIQAVPTAKDFWSKMGANGYFDLYDNTQIDWSSYAENRRSRDRKGNESAGAIRRELPARGEDAQGGQADAEGAGSFDPLDEEALNYLNNPDAWLTKGPRFSLLPEETALEDATAALDQEEQFKPDFIGQLQNDIGRIAKFVLHPRQIAALHKGFTPVYRTAISQFEMRDSIIDELQQDHRAYDELSNEGKRKVNAVLELGRLLSATYSKERLLNGIANPGEKNGIKFAPNGSTYRVKEKISAVMSGVGEIVQLTEEEADAYLSLRNMFDNALDKFKDQTLEDFGFPELVGDKGAAKKIMDMIDEDMPQERADRLSGIARFIQEIEQAKRTGYVPFARYGDYVVAVKEQQFPFKIIKNPDGGWLTRDMPSAYNKLLEDMGAKWNKLEQGYDLDANMRRALIQENEKTIYSVKVEFTLKDKLLIKAGKPVEELPSVKKALAEAEKLKDGQANRRVVAFEVIQKKPDGGIKLADVDALAEVAMLSPDAWDAVREQLGDAIKGQSFRKHFFQSDNVPGYTEDFERSIADYMAGMAGYLSRRHHNKRWETSVSAIKAPRLFEYASKYRDYANNPQEELAMLRKVGFMAYIAGVPMTAFANLTQPFIMTVPALNQIASMPLVMKEMTRAYKDALAMTTYKRGLDMFDPESAPADIREDLKKAWAGGMFVPLQTFEIMAIARQRNVGARKISKLFNNSIQGLAIAFSYAERLNRLVTFIASARLADKPGVKARAMQVYGRNNLARQTVLRNWSAETLADFMIDETQFRMGKANRPVIMRGMGSVIMQFKGFVMQSLEAWFRWASQGGMQGVKAAAMSIGAIALMGGLWGIPGADDLRDLVEKAYKQVTHQDLDLKTELRMGLYEATGQRWISEVASKGATYPFGLDLSRIGMGNIAPDSPLQVFGIPADLFIGRPSRAFQKGVNGDVVGAAAEMLPNFLKNPVTALSWKSNGVRDNAGRMLIDPEEVKPGSLVAKSLGAQPRQVTDLRDYEYSQYRMQTANDRLKRDYVSSIAKEFAQIYKHPEREAQHRAEIEKLKEEVRQFNVDKPLSERIVLGREAIQNRIRQEVGGIGVTWGKERKQARGESANMREAFGLEDEVEK